MASFLLLAALSGPGDPAVLACECDPLDPGCDNRVAPAVLTPVPDPRFAVAACECDPLDPTCNSFTPPAALVMDCDPLDPGCNGRVAPGVLTPVPDPMFAVAAR